MFLVDCIFNVFHCFPFLAHRMCSSGRGVAPCIRELIPRNRSRMCEPIGIRWDGCVFTHCTHSSQDDCLLSTFCFRLWLWKINKSIAMRFQVIEKQARVEMRSPAWTVNGISVNVLKNMWTLDHLRTGAESALRSNAIYPYRWGACDCLSGFIGYRLGVVSYCSSLLRVGKFVFKFVQALWRLFGFRNDFRTDGRFS